MDSRPQIVVATCSNCQSESLCGPPEMQQWLRDIGMLRRSEKPEAELVAELFAQSSHQFRCGECGAVGMRLAPPAVPDDEVAEDDEWLEVRKCEICKQPIPSERLEVFPDARRCVACQSSGAEAVEEEFEYCRHCGAVMELRQTGGSGITRYRMVCSECKR